VFLIMGLQGVTRSVAEGEFTCPACRCLRGYRRRRTRRYFTIFFIPAVPLGTLGEWVECKTCGSTFPPALLEMQSGGGLQSDSNKQIEGR
jgi:hypothetical protein